ncbi:MAG: hypothetical protein KDE27_07385 [Planctomycetes bacterium]|nr:hypothetical protein [Planctomycetota bacterium]
MTDPTIVARRAAVDRLFETHLAEAVTGDPLATLRTRRSDPQRWFAAAAVLLGALVAVASWWMDRSVRQTPAQAPARLPPATRVDGTAGLQSAAAELVNIDLREALPGDLPLLSRFPGLRALRIDARLADGGQEAWRRAEPVALVPLADCGGLERLTLPAAMRLTPAHLRELANCRRLSTVSFSFDSLTLDEGTAAALQGWPALHTLILVGTRITAAGVRALGAVAGLQRLDLYTPPGLDESTFEALSELENVADLRFYGLGNEPVLGAAGSPAWEPTPADLELLARMPRLHGLVLYGGILETEHVNALPPQLTALQVGPRRPISPAAFTAMRRLPLRQLGVGPLPGTDAELAAATAAAIDLIGTLRLQDLEWGTPPTPELLRAAAGQPDLRKLSLGWTPDVALAPLCTARALDWLALYDRTPEPRPAPRPDVLAATFRPLRAIDSLALVTLFHPYSDSRQLGERHREAIAHELGSRIRFTLIR